MSSSYWEILNMLSVFVWHPSWADIRMSPLQSEAAKEFRQPRLSLLPPWQEGAAWQVFLQSMFNHPQFCPHIHICTHPCLCHLGSMHELIIKITGKSSPMMETFSAFSMVGVYETRKGLKFVHITSEKFAGKFTIIIFMDNRLNRPCALLLWTLCLSNTW